MTDLTDLMRKGLEEALCQHIAKLFNVVMSDTTDEAIERFRKGVVKSRQVYAALLAVIDDE